jgi:ABC-2 type transport system permease protein
LSRDPRLVVAGRELASLRKEKTIVLAIVIQLFVAGFSSFLVVGLVSMYDPGSIDGYEMDVAVAGDHTRELVQAAEDTGSVDATVYPTREAAADAFADGGAGALVLTRTLPSGQVRATVRIPEGSVRSTVAVVQVRTMLEDYEERLREKRSAGVEREVLRVPPRTQSSPYFGFTYTVLVPLLLFMPVFIGGSIAVDSLSEEMERGTFELLRVAPTTPVQLMEGKLLAAAGPVPAQAALWIGLLWLNGTSVVHVPELLVLTTAMAVSVAALGLGVAAATRDRRFAQFLYSSGLLVLFGATLLLPENPANTVARLAVGSPGPGTYVALSGYVLIAAVAVLGVRQLPRAVDADHL